MRRVPIPTVLRAVAASLLLTGCSSVPKEPLPSEGAFEVPSATNAPSGTAAQVEPPVPPPATNPPPTAVAVRPPAVQPIPGPKPWTVTLEHGSRRAVVDGVTLWLSEPAKQGADKTVAAVPADHRASLQPLLQAGTNAFVRNRPLRIMLDPGHGGEDPGAPSRDQKHRESALVLDVARRLSTYLTRAGHDVRMTRSDDSFVPLEDRPAMASAWPADVFVSLHLNSAPDGSANGLETFALPPAGMRATSQVDLPTLSAAAAAQVRQRYPGNAHDADNLRLAFCIQRRLLKTTGSADRGVRRARFAVLRDATVPAVLVEAGFLSNRSDTDFLATPNGRERVARGIYQGLCDFADGHIAPGHPAAPVRPATLVVP